MMVISPEDDAVPLRMDSVSVYLCICVIVYLFSALHYCAFAYLYSPKLVMMGILHIVDAGSSSILLE